LKQRGLAAKLPKWLGWDHVTIAKAETNRRRITLPEIREYARACGSSVESIDRRALEIQSALAHVPGVGDKELQRTRYPIRWSGRAWAAACGVTGWSLWWRLETRLKRQP
jgi:hypothetical protein